MFVPGLVHCVWLKVLKVSIRSSNLTLSVNRNSLKIDMFQLLRPGPRNIFLCIFPHCSAAGIWNDAVLNHCVSGLWICDGGDYVRPVGGATAIPEVVVASADGKRGSALETCDAGVYPSSQYLIGHSL